MAMQARTFRGQYGLDSSLRLTVSMENPLELRLVVEHYDGNAYIALDAVEVQKLRDSLTEWLELIRRAPLAAGRHS